MNKPIPSYALEKLRERIINAFGKNKYNVSIHINIESTGLIAIYNGHRVCKITDWHNFDGTYYIVFADDFIFEPHLSLPESCTCVENIVYCIEQRIVYYNKKKGQEDMMTLGDLRDYICQELGNLVAAVYDPGKTGPGPNNDRIKINHGGWWVCSVYRNKPSNGNLFTVIFYDPFICRSEGYSSVVDLTVAEVPRAIKNRINICKGDNGKCAVSDSDSTIDKILSQCKGGFTYANPVMKTGRINITVDSFIKDVIFNDPATIVFWVDGSKTVVKCQPGETFDPEKGLAMAISKKVLGNDYGYYETFAKHVGRYNKKHKEK